MKTTLVFSDDNSDRRIEYVEYAGDEMTVWSGHVFHGKACARCIADASTAAHDWVESKMLPDGLEPQGFPDGTAFSGQRDGFHTAYDPNHYNGRHLGLGAVFFMDGTQRHHIHPLSSTEMVTDPELIPGLTQDWIENRRFPSSPDLTRTASRESVKSPARDKGVAPAQ